MNYENQKSACEDYAKRNGGSVADVLRVSGRKGAAVLSKDGRILYDPFVTEPVKEAIVADAKPKDIEPAEGEINAEVTKPAPKKKAQAKKK